MGKVADGAWGIRVPGLAAQAGRVLVQAPDDWPAVQVHTVARNPPSRAVEWGPKTAQYVLLGGHHIRIDRDPLRVELELERPTVPEAVVVPHLSSAASTVALWHGREAFHAGAFVYGRGAWGIVGEKGAGKTSTLAALNRMGIPVLTDDLLVLAAGEVLAGPRCLDLRREPAMELEEGHDLGIVGTRRRWRVYLGPCPLSVPFCGWVVPDWAPESGFELLAPERRLPLLPRFRALQVPWEHPASLLDLAAYPAVRWTRPRRIAELESSTLHLLHELEHL